MLEEARVKREGGVGLEMSGKGFQNSQETGEKVGRKQVKVQTSRTEAWLEINNHTSAVAAIRRAMWFSPAELSYPG